MQIITKISKGFKTKIKKRESIDNNLNAEIK